MEDMSLKSQLVLCAHELGHALLHSDDINNFAVTSKNAFKNVEYEANPFCCIAAV